MLMKRFTGPGLRPQVRKGRRRARRTGAGILLITVGAILRFAITVHSTHVLDVHVVGVILMIAGVISLLLPGSARAILPSGWLRTSWVSPGESRGSGEPQRPGEAQSLGELQGYGGPQGYGAGQAGLDTGVALDAPGNSEDDL
jgi:hypothetical protein